MVKLTVPALPRLAMSLHDDKTLERIEPVVRRVLIIDASPYAAKLLGELIKGMGGRNVVFESDGDRVLDIAERLEPTLVFVERSGPRLDGEAVARKLRRSRLGCRKAPIIMVTAEATASNIKGARDSGVHEFLVKPFATGDLLRRLINVATKPRDWVEGVAYVGPDRRRFNSGEYEGPKKRSREIAQPADGFEADFTPATETAPPPAAREPSGQEISAVLGRLDSDPDALAFLMRQAEAIKTAALATRRTRLAVAAAELHAACVAHGPDPAALAEPVRMLVAAIDAQGVGGSTGAAA